MNIELHLLDRNIKLFLRSFLILLTFGVSVGLAYLYYTTNYSVDGAVTRYKGSELNDADFEIADNYPKPVSGGNRDGRRTSRCAVSSAGRCLLSD